MIEGVPTYKVTLQFDEKDERIKSGMTANLDITTNRHDNAISVSQRAIITKNNEKFVRVLEGQTIKEKPVKVGIKGSDGNIEITEGLIEGEKVVDFIQGQ